MKKYLLLLALITLGLSSQAQFKNIDYKGISNVRVEGMKDGKLIVVADASFYNPNKISLKIRAAKITVNTEGGKLADARAVERVKIKPKSAFTIPLRAELDLNDSNSASGIIGLLGKKSLEISYKGVLKLRVFILPFKVKVKDTVKIRI
ncbi:MAG: LEA type 2 family protein [Cyclobacteriaceae bacterium]|nr:LEA type 2 family protein [Cyclobacteriaceae bacterium]